MDDVEWVFVVVRCLVFDEVPLVVVCSEEEDVDADSEVLWLRDDVEWELAYISRSMRSFQKKRKRKWKVNLQINEETFGFFGWKKIFGFC